MPITLATRNRLSITQVDRGDVTVVGTHAQYGGLNHRVLAQPKCLLMIDMARMELYYMSDGLRAVTDPIVCRVGETLAETTAALNVVPANRFDAVIDSGRYIRLIGKAGGPYAGLGWPFIDIKEDAILAFDAAKPDVYWIQNGRLEDIAHWLVCFGSDISEL
jgi:hypothetical protein